MAELSFGKNLHTIVCEVSRDETTDLTTGTNKYYFNIPWAKAKLLEANAGVNTAPTDASCLVDVNKNGTTVFSSRITIDDGDVFGYSTISVSAFVREDVVSIDIDQIGATAAGKGLKVYLTFLVY